MDGDTFSEVIRLLTTNYVLLAFVLTVPIATFLSAIFEPPPKTVYFPIIIGIVCGVAVALIVAVFLSITSSAIALVIFCVIILVAILSVLGNAIGNWRDNRND